VRDSAAALLLIAGLMVALFVVAVKRDSNLEHGVRNEPQVVTKCSAE